MKNQHLTVEVAMLLIGLAVTGTALTSLWSKITNPQAFDRDTVIKLAKIWFGWSGFALLLFLVLKFT